MKKFKPKNKIISDIYYRLYANTPTQNREHVNGEWKILERRIKENYRGTLVPVVSLEWIERYCKEHKYEYTMKLSTGRGYDSEVVIDVDDLLLSAKKEACK